MGLETYWKKRDFRKTPEPKGKIAKANKHRFVCQEHHASSLHFDFRLEIDGVLKSWSVRKGPSLNPQVRRLAVPTEDHPVEYLKFQGDIPEGNYGAGQHRIWDSGTYKLLDGKSPETQLEKGKLKIELKGEKLKGVFNLFKLGQRDQWLLLKSNDEHAQSDWRLELLIPDADGNKFILDEPKTSSPRRHQPNKQTKGNKGVVKKDAGVKRSERLGTLASVLKKKNLDGDVRIKVGKYAVELTSLDRVYWPDEGYTKADLIRYYSDVWNYIKPHLINRPVIMKRYPVGIRGYSFHQHDVDEVPEFVETVELEAEDEKGLHKVDYVVCQNLPTHLYLANLGAIERHPFHSKVRKLDFPDWFVFDLDPGDKAEFETICEVAINARDVIAEFGLRSYAKTSGSRGIHIYVPIKAVNTYEQVAGLASKIAKRVADSIPNAATVERSKNKRKKGQIYVDHMQNAYGKSVVAPYSVRPKPGATVSAPLTWDEVAKKEIRTADFTIKNMSARLKKKGDLFAKVLTDKQTLESAMESTLHNRFI
ncbi:MAG: non-homologous end-joining DNA ligase [Pyrinomonadaceae bacterium]